MFLYFSVENGHFFGKQNRNRQIPSLLSHKNEAKLLCIHSLIVFLFIFACLWHVEVAFNSLVQSRETTAKSNVFRWFANHRLGNRSVEILLLENMNGKQKWRNY